MCYYNGQRVDKAEYIRLKNLEKAVSNYGFLDRQIQFGFQYSQCAVLVPVFNESEDFEIVQMEWGFLPSYVPNREEAAKFRTGYKNAEGKWIQGYTTLNAKAENLFVNEKGRKSIFADAARSRRCLVLSTGFFEWRHLPKLGKKGQTLKATEKYPYYISVKDQEYFFMAGIYEPWIDRETNERVNTVAILTTEANSLMAQIHNTKLRMPTILDNDLAHEWLFSDLNEERITEIAKTHIHSRDMEACSISKEFLKELEPTKPFSYEEVPALELNV